MAVGPVLRLMLWVEHPDKTSRQYIAAIVDSGASRSYFTLDVADELGIRDELEEFGRSVGLGSEFQTWRSRKPVKAQILAIYPEPQGPTLVGPVFELDPSFGEPQDSLLGREDFFRAFTITFDENPVKPTLTLEWPEALASAGARALSTHPALERSPVPEMVLARITITNRNVIASCDTARIFAAPAVGTTSP